MPTLFLAEDEPTVLMLAESILEDAGFVVMTASDGGQAIAILNGSHPVDVVVTDINMGMVRTAMQSRPPLPG